MQIPKIPLPFPTLHLPSPLFRTPKRSLALQLPLKSSKGTKKVTVESQHPYDVEALLEKLSSLPPRGSIARCLDSFKTKLTLNDLAFVFREFETRHDWQRSLRLFKYMQRQSWCKPDQNITTILITLLGREGLLDKSREIFDDIRSPSALTYTALINAYGRNGDYKTGLELLERMQRDGVAPTALTYNTVLNACARGGMEWEGLLGLFAEMRHKGMQPDLVTYNVLLKTCAGRGLKEEAEMVFRTMSESGVVPDLTTYRFLVKAVGPGKVRELIRGTESFPEVESWNVVLEAYEELRDAKGAMEVFREMGGVGNAGTYSILLSLFGRDGMYDSVRELFLEMKVSGTEPDSGTYNILIKVFGEGGYFREVVTLFDDMVEEGVKPDMETYEGLIFACGKGGLNEDAKRILLHMNENGVVASSKAFNGVIEVCGQAAMYEEALVTFNTMNEMGSKPTVETYNSLIHAFSKGGLYKEAEAIWSGMGDLVVERNRDTFNGMIEAFRQAGRYEDALKTYVEMGKARCDPDERTLEAVLSVYCFAGLADETHEQFREIKASGLLPNIMCYCMMLAVYAKNGRWDNVDDLLDEMCSNRLSNIHQVIGQMIKGDFDDESNWQMVEYVFDKLKSEGCSLGIRFYNALLEALWWLGQRERGARVLNEATKRGLFPELFRKNSLVWSADVHRMWEGSACTAISIWLNDMHEMFLYGEDLPQIATVVVTGVMEESSKAQDYPIAKAAYSFLNSNVSSFWSFPGWNNGRIVCNRTHLRKILSGAESTSTRSREDKIIILSNSPFPRGTKKPVGDMNSDENIDVSPQTRTDILTSAI